MAPHAPRATTIGELLDRYDGLLLDAFGVLVEVGGLVPAGRRLLQALAARGTPHAIVTNDASRSLALHVRRLEGLVPVTHIVTSGALLVDYFASRGLVGTRTCVLGTDDSVAYVRAAGGVPVPLAPGMELDVLAVCDDGGTPFLDGIDLALSAVVRAIDAGRRPALVLPNPDLIYPKGGGELGITAGAMGLVIEAALARRFPALGVTFDRLGKPAPHLFVEAARRLGIAPARLCAIGDQLETDIAGACAAGIASALIAGISRWDPATEVSAAIAPTYLLATIEP